MSNIANLANAQLADCVQSHPASSNCQLLLGKGCGLMLMGQLGACPDGAALVVDLATADAAAAAAAAS